MNRSTFNPGPLADVDALRGADGSTLVFVRELAHSPERVWTALTDPQHLLQWAPFTADRDLGSVGEATLTMVDGDTREDLPAVVLQAERPTLLEYTLGSDRVRWELAAMGSGTRLTLHHTVGEDDLIPKVAAGWHLCLDVAERLLAGDPVGPIRGEDAKNHGWEELHDAYAERLGLEA